MEYPLQTRAVYLAPDRMESTERIERTLNELVARSYNTVIVPVLYEGSLTFPADTHGCLKDYHCDGCEVLEILREYELSVWLSVDLLTAGTPGSNELGTLASPNRPWLMRNIHGGFAPPGMEDIPALFCWTSLDFRRLIGNLLVEITERYPLDGVVFDLRHIPQSTTDPATWTHLGFSCLQRIQRELGFDLEEFLSEPTLEKFEMIKSWREDQLIIMLENLKSRVQKIRRELQFSILGQIGKPDDPFIPWDEDVDNGLVEELIIYAAAEELPRHVEVLERYLEEPRPLLVAIDTETSLADVARALEKLPATGFCVLHPGPLQRVVMPDPEYTWSLPGALEHHPVFAATEIIRHLIEEFEGSEQLRGFLQRVDEFLVNSADLMKYEEAMKIRREILGVLWKIRDEELDVDGNREDAMRKLDLVTRLLLLTPVQAIEY